MFDKKINFNLDILIVWSVLCFGLFIVITTELLSLNKWIFSQIILISWVFFFITLFLIIKKIIGKKFNYKNSYIKLDKLSKFCLYFIILIFIITFAISIIYPPNTPDSMSYHMPRVMQWIQNQEVNFYSTSVTRQLFISPFSGYLIMHLYLIFGDDLVVNLAQWFAMVVSVFVTSFIIRLYIKKMFPILVGMLFCATLPMGILQSTSTQIDYMVSMWLLIMIYFLLKYQKIQNLNYILGFGISLSLAILTKQTAYIFAFPFCLYLLFLVLKNKRNDFIKLFIIPILIFAINFSHYNRNYETFNNFLGINQKSKSTINQTINLKALSSNLIRNFSLNLILPNSFFNESVRNTVYLYHDLIDQNVISPKTTFKNEYFIHFSLYETRASNTLHFLLILFFVSLIFFRNHKFNFTCKGYLISLLLSFLLFCTILKWQPWGNRLLLPFFVMFSPIIGVYLNYLKKPILNTIIVSLLSIYSLPFLFMNEIRPLITKITNNNYKLNFEKPYFLNNKREKLYFAYNFKQYDNYIKIKKVSQKINCKNIGIISGENTWEYPYWKMLKDYNNDIIIRHIDVKNLSSKFTKKNFKPCLVIEFYPQNKKFKSLNDFKKNKKLDEMKIYY